MATNNDKPIAVTAAAHPFRVERTELVVEPGTSISDILERAQPDPILRRHAVVEVGGVTVSPEWWPYLRPKSPVMVRVLPSGGGDDKDLTRTVLLIAVTVVSAGITSGAMFGGVTGAGAAGGAAGGATVGSIALGTAVGIAGRALINQIAPPAGTSRDMNELGGDDGSSASHSIQGARNRVRRYGVVPRVFGRHRMVPPYAAEPFTEIDGEDQYLRALFLWGYGPVEVTNLRIGDTPIDAFEDVETETVTDITEEGHPDLFSRSVDERTLQVSLTNAAGYQQRTTDDVADEMSVDVVFPRGLYELNDDGSKSTRTVVIDVEYAEAGTGNWKTGNVSVSAQSTTIDVPSSRSRPAGARGPSTVHYQHKYAIVIDRSDGSLSVVKSDRAARVTTFSSVPDPSIPPWAYGIAMVKADSDNGITDVVELDDPGFTGFGVTADGFNGLDIDSGTITKRQIVATEKKAEAIRRTIKLKMPDGSKAYDVRLKRETADSNDDSVFDQTTWHKLRAIQREKPITMEHVAVTAVRIKATGQLNGRIDELNGDVEAVMPEYDPDTDSWVDGALASSPAAAYRNILEGRANGRAPGLSRIDLDALESWVEFTKPRGLEFNHVIDYDSSVTEALDMAASAGRASKGLTDGLWTVNVDEPKSEIVQHLSPRNTFNFQGEKAFSEKTHALRVRFLNEDAGYQQDEIIVYNDGYTADGNPPDNTPPFPDEDGNYSIATVFDEIEPRGCTNENQAFREGRYHLAVDELRPEVYTFGMDVEHLVATRGDRIKAAHDVPQWGTGQGRVKSVSTDSNGDVDEVEIDESVVLEAGNDYVVRFRTSDFVSKLVDVDDPGVDTATSTLTPVTPISSDKPAVGDIAFVGISGQESVDLIIKTIDTDEDLNAKLTCLDYSPAIFDAYDEAIPNFDPRITETLPFREVEPALPDSVSIQSDESVLRRNPDGTVSERMVVTFSNRSDDAVPPRTVEMRFRQVDSGSAWTIVSAAAEAGQIPTDDVDTDESYRVEIRSISGFGVESDWTLIDSSHTVEGKSNPPGDVTGFVVNAARDRIEFVWDENPELDVAKYEVREGTVWETATVIAKTDSTEHQTRNVSNGPWLIKAIDSQKNYSINATSASISVNMPDVDSFRAQVIDNTVLLRWSSTAGTFDLATHQIRRGNDFETAEVVGTSDKTFDNISELEGGTYKYWVAGVDAAGNVGPEESLTVDVDDPPDFELREQFQTDWQGYSTTALTPIEKTSTIFRRSVRDFTGIELDGVDDEVALNDALDAAQTNLTFEAWFQTLSDGTLASWDRGEYFRMELGGDAADPGRVGVSFFDSVDGVVDGLGGTAFVDDGRWHHVAFVYEGSIEARLYVDGVEEATYTLSSGSQLGSGTTRYGFLGVGSEADTFNGPTSPTDRLDGRLTEVRRWTIARTATEIDDNKDRTLDGTETGLASYWRIQADSSSEEPPVITDKSTNGHDGQLNGGTRYTPSIRALVPNDDLSRDELDGLGYGSRDDMINAGYDYRAQPTPGSGQYVEVYDAGVVVPSTSVIVTHSKTDVVGSASVTITISTRENAGDAWNDFPAGQTQVFATQFRWVKVTIDYSVSDDTDFAVLDELRTTLRTKIKDDSGTVPVTANPTTVPFNVDYTEVQSVVATPQGSTPLTAVVDFGGGTNPSSFDVYLFDGDGNAATGDVRWNARGI